MYEYGFWWYIIRVFCPRAGLLLQTQAPRLQFCPKAGFPSHSGTKVAVLLGMNRYYNCPLLSAPHSLFSIWTNLNRSEKIPGTQTLRWREWIWLTGPSGFWWLWLRNDVLERICTKFPYLCVLTVGESSRKNFKQKIHLTGVLTRALWVRERR